MNVQDLFGEVISSYSDDQAIEDGVLVHPFPEKWPYLLVTATVYGECERVAESRGIPIEPVLVPLLIDCIMATKAAVKHRRDADLVTLEHTAVGTVWVRPNGAGGMTVMKPEDN